jgi:hypothetical protein
MRRTVIAGLFILVSLFSAILLSGCRTNMVPYEAGDVGNSRKVLIAGEASEFKKNVVAEVIESLGTEDWYFRIIGLDQLEQEDTEHYGAILLITAMQGGRMSEKVITYLGQDPENPKMIVFFTRGSEDPLPEKYRLDIHVDAVSSASKDARVGLRAEQLVDLLERRF